MIKGKNGIQQLPVRFDFERGEVEVFSKKWDGYMFAYRLAEIDFEKLLELCKYNQENLGVNMRGELC